jgi:hypothetical protein
VGQVPTRFSHANAWFGPKKLTVNFCRSGREVRTDAADEAACLKLVAPWYRSGKSDAAETRHVRAASKSPENAPCTRAKFTQGFVMPMH